MYSFPQLLASLSAFTNMPLTEVASLRSAVSEAADLPGHVVVDPQASIAWSDLVGGSVLYGRGDELSGRSVLVTTRDQITMAAALMELDGIARRIVLCPPDLPLEHLPYVIDAAEVDAIVSDRAVLQQGKSRPMYFIPCNRKITPANHNGCSDQQTEWILLTSGTTGLPKLVVHTLSSLTGAVRRSEELNKRIVWSTFYDIRRYGGLQILLRAAQAGASLVLSDGEESTAQFLARAGAYEVTHISGTPSHWRRALMSPSIHLIAPAYIRISGEIADQGILSQLRSVFPHARIVHAFASTEAGVAFEVHDCKAGFPADVIENTPGVEMKIQDGTLRIRSARNANRYLGENVPNLKDGDGFVDTGDILELRDGRYYFMGRRGGVINVGGLKVYPEEVEAVINRHPEVQISLVRAKKSPITGALVVADVVLNPDPSSADRDVNAIRDDILLRCRETLSLYKVPAAIHIVPALIVATSGKVLRRDA
jgi:acyl-CoA synthetase (AMP-forming)/AMP-acid ligase II